MREKEERKGERTPLTTEIICVARREETGRRRLGRRRREERKGEGGEISPSCYARAHAGEQGGETAERRKREKEVRDIGFTGERAVVDFG